MFFWQTTTLSDLIKSILLHIRCYEQKKWLWQSNHTAINQVKNLLSSSDKTTLSNHQLWELFELLRSYTDDDQDPAANLAIVKIKRSFPYYQRLADLSGIYYFKDRLSDIIINCRLRPTIINVLEELDKLDLLSRYAIRDFAITESETAANIIKIFAAELDEALFLQLIKLHSYGCYLFETELTTLATHPHREALFSALAQFHAHKCLPRDRQVCSNIIAHDETGDVTILIRRMEDYGMINQPLLDLCGIISGDKRDGMLYALQSMHESAIPLNDTYFLNVKKILAALLSLNIFTRENTDRALNYAKEEKLVNAFNHLNNFAINLKTSFTPLSLADPQSYFDAIAAHPYPEEIAYCLSNWRDGRTIEGLDTCLAITDFNMIRLLSRFIDSSTLQPDILDSLRQLGEVYTAQDLQEITDAFDSLYNYMFSREIWSDNGKYFMQLCTIAQENPAKGKEKLLEYTQSIRRKDYIERERRLTMMFSGPNVQSRSNLATSFTPSYTG